MSAQQPPVTQEPFDPVPGLAAELGLSRSSVAAVVKLMSEGATVPFIARYRKEATGGLDEVQIRTLAERFEYVTELESRRTTIVEEIQRQGKLSSELLLKLRSVTTKAELEDLYLPFKPKRRTRGTMAVERGLLPLADAMWTQDASASPKERARSFVKPEQEVADVAAALAGARDICAERLAEDSELRKRVRESFLRDGIIHVKKKSEFADQVTKFDMYASFEEPIAKLPSHRYLAIRRGENEGVLYATLSMPSEPWLPFARSRVPVRSGTPWQAELELVVKDALDRLLLPAAASDARVELKLRSDLEAIGVFARNLGELLLSAPLGGKVVLGVDPGQRTGCKCAVVDATGRLIEHATIYLVQGAAALDKAKQILLGLIQKHAVEAVAIGNGTHGRETEAFARECLNEAGLSGRVPCVSVSEAGASVYSASDLAREEFPDLDLTVRGAISIARRLQDPLAELVKIDPKSIGVGQYQHDVTQSALGRKLDEVVESCVNNVGVELNTASAPLLSRVSGIGPSLAKRIVAHRDQHGRFESRKALLKVSGMGPRTFEQAAGFLRVSGGTHPLDASAVHPERYGLVERMAQDVGVPLSALVGNSSLVERLELSRYKSSDVGEFTLADIRAELDKPGRDPRKVFEPPQFRDDVRTLQDLVVGMELQGVVTNITAFGAFVDVGVHQDGLVHISQLADRFVKDPHEVVKVGDKLKVRVLEVDLQRKRIALSARSAALATPGSASSRQHSEQSRAQPTQPQGDRRSPSGNPAGNAGMGSRQSSSERTRKAPANTSKTSPAGNSTDRDQEGAFKHNPFADFFNKS